MKKFGLSLLLIFIISKSSIAQSIWGGTPITISQAPYQALVMRGTLPYGGGVVLSDRWILAAAHGFNTGQPTWYFSVYVGVTDPNNILSTAQWSQIDTIILHPGNASFSPYNDLALLHLKNPILFNTNVQPINYASACNPIAQDVSPGTIVYSSGYGKLSPNNSNQPLQSLQGMNIHIVDSVQFTNIIGAPLVFPLIYTQLGLYDSGMGMTIGDSGGPTVITKNGKKILVGINSGFYRSVIDTNEYTTFCVNVREYASWIYSVTGLGNQNPSTDVYMQDRPEDLGFEPNAISTSMWSSEDIWVNTGGIFSPMHQNPEYYTTPGVYDFVHVRVRHRGCQPTDANTQKKVTLYWAKAGSALNWPNSWNGSQTYNNHSLGDVIGSCVISNMDPGQSTICTFQWNPPNPAWYVGYSPTPPSNLIVEESPHHFCLLARIEDVNSSSDPMTYTETANLYNNIKNNNNIACKNVTVVDLYPNYINGNDGGVFGGTIFIGNAWNNSERYKLEFANTSYFNGNKITDEAEITLSLDNPTWQKWQQGGYQGENVSIINPQTRQIKITGDNASISNLLFGANERTRIHLGFNFLTQEASEQTEYSYTVTQKDNQGNIVGGEDYLIRKQERDLFEADAGNNQEILKEDEAVITASQLTEQAIYNWYDANDSLI